VPLASSWRRSSSRWLKVWMWTCSWSGTVLTWPASSATIAAWRSLSSVLVVDAAVAGCPGAGAKARSPRRCSQFVLPRVDGPTYGIMRRWRRPGAAFCDRSPGATLPQHVESLDCAASRWRLLSAGSDTGLLHAAHGRSGEAEPPTSLARRPSTGAKEAFRADLSAADQHAKHDPAAISVPPDAQYPSWAQGNRSTSIRWRSCAGHDE